MVLIQQITERRVELIAKEGQRTWKTVFQLWITIRDTRACTASAKIMKIESVVCNCKVQI